jgi:signal transduction histidine kinase
MTFKNLKIGAKQMIGFGSVLIIMAGVNIFAIRKMAAIKAEIDEVSGNRLPRALAISDLNLNTSYLRINQLQLAFAPEAEAKRDLASTISALIDSINHNLDLYDSLRTESEQRGLYSTKERDLYTAFDREWEHYQDLSFTFFDLLREQEMQSALDLLNGEMRNVFDEFSGVLLQLVAVNQKDSFAAAHRAEITYRATRGITTLLLIGTIVLSAFIAMGLARRIATPVQQLAQAAGHVAQGDLDVSLKVTSRDEIGNLAESFNQMTKALREAKAKMQQQADELQAQQAILQSTNQELQEKSESLSKQNAEIERKNRDLERTMQQLQRTQYLLVQAEKMASLGQLTAGIAHEINNPVNFVSSNVKPLRRDIDEVLSIVNKYDDTIAGNHLQEKFVEIAKLKRDLNFSFLLDEIGNLLKGIEDGAQRTFEIVKGLRNFSRLDEEGKKLADINQGLESTLLMLKHQLKNRIEVVKDFGDLPQILCFPGKLNQVFMNILSNACQAIDGQGKIFVKTTYADEAVRISIKDTGRGMTDEVKQHIFEPFFTTKDVGEGTGLGLSITFGIIQDHDGNIEVFSAPGNGSEFVITLPAIQ